MLSKIAFGLPMAILPRSPETFRFSSGNTSTIQGEDFLMLFDWSNLTAKRVAKKKRLSLARQPLLE
jgi:hypothetical protein